MSFPQQNVDKISTHPSPYLRAFFIVNASDMMYNKRKQKSEVQ